MNTLTFSAGQLLAFLLAIIGGAGTLGAVLFVGIWFKYIRDRVRIEIKAYDAEPDTRDALKFLIVSVIDDQINRRDGIIHKEISKQVGESADELLKTLQEIRGGLSGVTEMATKLNRIEGSMAVIMNTLHAMPPTAASRPPQP